MRKYPTPLIKLFSYLKRLPGLGQKSAEKMVFQLLEWKSSDLSEFGELLATLLQKVGKCKECNAPLCQEENCSYCDPLLRNTTTLCIVASPKDLYAIEETCLFNGMYYVMKGLISPLDGKMEDVIDLTSLLCRIKKHEIREVFLALDATLEGDATSLYLKDVFQKIGVQVTRLASGVPLGSTLDYVDKMTLQMALKGRNTF